MTVGEWGYKAHRNKKKLSCSLHYVTRHCVVLRDLAHLICMIIFCLDVMYICCHHLYHGEISADQVKF